MLGAVSLCLLMTMLLAEVNAQSLPNTPYFNHIHGILQAINGYRTNGTHLKEDFDAMMAARELKESINGAPAGTYMCYDDWDDIKDNEDGTS